MGVGFLKGYRWLCITTFELIVLGGAVRALDAGLACPDWPLCFGDYIPDFHPQVYLEFIHRVLAGGIGLGVLYLNGRLLFDKQIHRHTKALAGLSFLLLGIQILLGGLTVLWQLQSKVVTAHLGLGTALFANLLWIYFSLQPQGKHVSSISRGLVAFVSGVAILIYGQILLGGTVASHYAALVCTDFPLCHGQWIPTLRGIIGIHVIHRLGAYIVFAAVMGLWFVSFRLRLQGEMRQRARQLAGLVLVQMTLGILNVVYYNPPLVTVLHLATATLMLAAVLRLKFLLGQSQNAVRKGARPAIQAVVASFQSPVVGLDGPA